MTPVKESGFRSAFRVRPAKTWESVMTSTITGAVTFFFILVGVWVADLVCYQPQPGVDPLSAPVTLSTQN